MNKEIKLALTFDDVLLVPQKSEVLPNEVAIETRLCDGIKLPTPLISAGMDTVTEWELAAALAQVGGMGVIHKSMSAELQASQVRKVKESPVTGSTPALDANGRLMCAAAVGVTADAKERAAALIEAGVDAVAVDTSHGHSSGVINKVRELKTAFPQLPIIAGNVATASAVRELALAGANVVKVGIGPGSICTTRIVAGVGVPQLTAIMDCVVAAEQCGITIIADGGIKHSGDIVKALAAGASAVMIGSLFASAVESPGELIEVDGKQLKRYRGMGSTGAMKAGSGDRYFQNETEKYVPEGVEGAVPCKGTVEDIVYQMIGGLRSGMGYCGARNMVELWHNAQFVQITQAGLGESHPHDLAMMQAEPNYSGR